MPIGLCTNCEAEKEYPSYLAGLSVRCLECKEGWVKLPRKQDDPNTVPPVAVKPTQTLATMSMPPPKSDPTPTSKPVPKQSHLTSTEAAAMNPTDLPRLQSALAGPLFRGGIWMIVFGIGSLILPAVGLQFKVLSPLEPAQPFVGLVLALVGGALMFYTSGDRRD